MPSSPAHAASKRLVAIAVLVAACVNASAVLAQQPPAPTQQQQQAPRRTVDLLIRSAPAEDTRPLEDTIRELLARLQITVVNRAASGRAANPSSLLATVDVDLVPADEARVIVRSASGSTVLDRTIPRDANLAITREQIASAVRGATEAEILVDEDRVAGRAPPVVEPPPEPTRTPPPPPAAPAIVETIAPPKAEAPPTPPPSTPSTLALDLATFAGAGVFSSDSNPVARVGGGVAVASRRGLRPSFALAALYAFPFEGGDDDGTLTARATIVSLRALPALQLVHRARWGIDFGAGGGIDVLSVDPASTVLPSSAFPETTTTRVNPILTGAITGRVALASDVVLTLTAMTDVDLAARRYVFDNRGSRADILVPWDVRPTLLAGLSFTAFGEGGFR